LLFDSGVPNASPYVKDGFHRYLVDGDSAAVNPDMQGTKAAALYEGTIAAGETRVLRLRLSTAARKLPSKVFDVVFAQRII
jgi:hypothetical protein